SWCRPPVLRSLPTRRSSDLGAGAEVVEPAAGPQAVGDGLDGAGDVREVWGDRLHRVRVLVVHEADEVEGLEGVELVGAKVDFLRSEEHTSELQSRVDLVCRL